MTHNVTIVTALYDIKRETQGDGRTMDEYFEWFERTLQLNATFVVYIQDTLLTRFGNIMQRLAKSSVTVYVTKLEEIPYYRYKDEMQNVLQSEQYKTAIAFPSRIECKLALYNIIQYSKLDWIKQTIRNNPYNSDYFFWMDAGCSRFFQDTDLNKPWPNQSKLNPNKIIIQGRNDLYQFNNWDYLHLDAVNLLCGTLFGGHKNTMLWLCKKINETFEHLLKTNIVNNEQIALAIVWKQHQSEFDIFINNTSFHLPLFKYLSY